MRFDWVPASAASLIAGAVTLALGSTLLPGGDTPTESLHLVEQHDSQWLAVSVLFFIAAIALVLGLPAVLTLFQKRGGLLGLVGCCIFLIGCVGTAGYAMLLAFFRALALSGAVRAEALDEVVADPGLNGFLLGWVAAFYLGELLIGLALLRAGTTSKWVPALLLAHVATLPLGALAPRLFGSWTIVFMGVGFAGVAIAANSRQGVKGESVQFSSR
ncbi:hypothetical protein [Nocardioides sp. Root151]|uniref:hypothetical protein n=1 Tax=Nocardioides sp. Root151 TaxID=1736475 RepID=UPI0007038B51|nr:hypothetical protein [Nocardioides sp. Root151]KQZ75580.1 hypothetical protein ASD66_04340 [Nocardioides sp. Root151]